MHIDWIDRWKGLLIILVVAGHVFGGACHFCTGVDSAACALLYKIIYMFHMPAFFFLAGLCWKSKDGDFVHFALNKARRLLIPYVAFGLASVVLYLLMTQGGNLFAAASDEYYKGKGANDFFQPFLSLLIGNGWPNGEGFRCNSVLWFLPSMFSVLCFYWLVDHVLKGRLPQLALAVVLLALEFLRRKYGFLNLPFGLSHIPWYGSFLIIGCQFHYTTTTTNYNFAIHHSPHMFSIWFLKILFAISAWLIFSVLAYVEPNAIFAYFNSHWYLVFFIMTILGIFLSAVTAKILIWDWLAKVGRASLGIMLIHKFIVIFLQVKLPIVSQLAQCSSLYFWFANFGVLVLGVVISWLATILIRSWMPVVIGE